MVYKSPLTVILTSLMIGIAAGGLSPRLLEIYTSICGIDNLCSAETNNPLEEGNIPTKTCPHCTCMQINGPHDPRCPDINPSAKCYNVSILSASITAEQHHFMYAIDKCYEDKNLTKQDLCSNLKYDFTDSDSYPASGIYNGVRLMFRNLHCADCNNATNVEKTRIEPVGEPYREVCLSPWKGNWRMS